ncbi:DUF2690 domain-containing protein [Streptomyces chattanoogensis]|uniref:DUF2690 domain-containing protein n=1 Tax=Streptomyces chattanoogensis TaxID=66876 RepID=UPI0036B7BD8F
MSNHVDEPDPEPDPEPTPVPSPSLLQRSWARMQILGRRLRAHARHALVVGVITAVLGPLAGYLVPKLFEDPPPPCPGAGCDGKNPKDYGCAADVTSWTPPGGNPVGVQLRYSKRCGAVWGRITRGEPGDTVTVQVTGGSSRSASIDYGPDQYTKMARVGAGFRVRLCAEPSAGPDRKRSWVRYCFQATEHSPWN